MKKIRGIIEDEEHTFASFVSPSGNGFKILVKIDPQKVNHRGQFLALEKYFNELLSPYEVDQSGKDLARVCYESYDPDTFKNEDSEVWCEVLEEKIVETNIDNYDLIIDNLQKWINSKESYIESNRNNYMSKFMYALCRYGIPEWKAKSYIDANFHGFPPKDLDAMAKSCYKKESFGSETFTEKQLHSKAVPKIADEIKDITSFWRTTDRGSVIIDTKLFLRFIEANGYGIYRPKDAIKNWNFVKVENMIVDIVDVLDIKKGILEYVEKNAPEPVFDHLQMKNRYFENTFLNALKIVQVDQVKDTVDTSFIFFEEFYYEITKDIVSKKDYIELEGVHIWRKQVCKKNITKVVDWRKHDFPQFLYRSMGKDEVKFKSACSAIGYGIHSYKKQRLAKLVYACDESTAELDGLANGGTGKKLYQQCLGFVRSVVEIDGKDFDKKDKFKFQNVADDTQIIIIDDYENDIKELFTKITGSFGIERKGMDKKIIEFSEAPKIFTSANVAPKGFSTSFARRLHVIEFTDYYNEDNTPADEFGDKDMFSDDWDQDDYNALYSFLFHCTQSYLKSGLPVIVVKDMKYKQMVKNNGNNFTDYWYNTRAYNMNEMHGGRVIFEDYKNETGDAEIKEQGFYHKCRKMCSLMGWKYVSTGSGKSRKICFKGYDFIAEKPVSNIEGQDPPF